MSSPIKELLDAATVARKAGDFEQCLVHARAALGKKPKARRAWRLVCFALFRLRRYKAARRECVRALGQREWSRRDREAMARLGRACRLLERLSSEPSGSAEGDWYGERLRRMERDGALEAFAVVESPSTTSARVRVGRDDVALMASRPGTIRDVRVGGDGGERDVDCLRGWPYDQSTGGICYVKDGITPLTCRPWCADTAAGRRRYDCYEGRGPCVRCVRSGLPEPKTKFPVWDPAVLLSRGASVHSHDELDVAWATPGLVAEESRRALAGALAKIAAADSPMPHYHNLIDPNLGATTAGMWAPTNVDVTEDPEMPAKILVLVELAAASKLGDRRLAFGQARSIVEIAGFAEAVARLRIQSPIHVDLSPHNHAPLYLAIEDVLTAAAPLLAKLRRPAFLLPGSLQVVVKAQRIVVDAGAAYSGCWHDEGLREDVQAVILYYYGVSTNLQGGDMEFVSKRRTAVWSGDAGGPIFEEDTARHIVETLPRCRVPIREGSILVFSNYASVHRVLSLTATGAGGSRDFLALFVLDQRRPLPSVSSATFADRGTRLALRDELLSQQLQPRGAFGLDDSHVYSTGNGSVADLGWTPNPGRSHVEDAYPDSAALVERLNISPPVLNRGTSYVLQMPVPPRTSAAQLGWSDWSRRRGRWSQHNVGTDAATAPDVVIFVDWDSYECTTRYLVPGTEGVSEVLHFRTLQDWGAYAEAECLLSSDDAADVAGWLATQEA